MSGGSGDEHPPVLLQLPKLSYMTEDFLRSEKSPWLKTTT